MNPEFIDGMSWEMAEVYGAITDQILINLAHYFRFYKPGVPVPKTSFEYQANMLAQMGQVNKDTVRIIRNGLAGADDALKNTLEQAIIDSVRKAQPELLEAVKKGILSPAGKPVVAPSQMRVFQLYYQQASDKLNMVNTVMLESTQSAYQQCVSDVVAEMGVADGMNRIQTALDTAAGETVTGVSSWNQALKHATDRMKESGIVGFIDHAGRRWSAEAYTAMDIRTTVANTARAAVWETNQDFGNDLYQVSYHNGARPLCYPWQNKVISSIDAARTVVDLDGNEIEVIAQSATSYGQPAGLFGINCKHYPTPFIPGVSIIRGQPQDEETNERTYAESQEQRRLERKLREEKRDVMMAKAQGADPEEIKRLQDKAQRSSQEIQDFCDRTGRARHKDRETVYTKRDFPDKGKYNVAEFERKQKETIDQYFGGGGAQQGYTFGQMTPNATQVTPTTPETPTAQPAINPDVVTFNPAKTRAEAEAYAREHFAEHVDYTGINLANANKVNETLTELTQKYPINRLDSIQQKAMGAVARASDDHLIINGKKLGKVLNEEDIVFMSEQKSAREGIERIKGRYKGKLPWSAENSIEKLEKKLRFTRWGVHSSYDDHVKAVVTHEYGHILSDQYFGMINQDRANPNYATNWSLRHMSEKWRVAFDKAISNGDIYKLSEYGSKNPHEFFAESFAARELGETLPDYVEELLEEVLKNGIM